MRFVGREEVLARLDEWLDEDDEAGWVIVTGGPGMGKSAILAAWLARREAAGVRVPHHFIRRQMSDWDQPDVIESSLATQIEERFPKLVDPNAEPEGRLVELLERVSKQLDDRRLIIVVDGLDETDAEPGVNPLPQFLPQVVPPGIRFLCATRPTYPHLNWLEARSPVRWLDLDEARWAASNEAVVRGVWQAVRPSYRPPLSDDIVATAVVRAEGNVLHAIMLHDVLRDQPAAERRADIFPRGLRALVGEIWDRAAAQECVRSGLGFLCAAREALSLDVLAEVAGWNYTDKLRFVREARQLLLEEPGAWAGIDAYRPRHDWVRELIAGRLGAAIMRMHHVTLARDLVVWPSPQGAAVKRYALRHALHHRAEAGNLVGAWRLAGDMSFLATRCREVGGWETEVELSQVAARCMAAGEETLAEMFDDLTWALARESHRLAVNHDIAAGLVWNRLRQAGWSVTKLDEQLTIPYDAAFLRLRSVVARPSALIRDLVDHASWVTACAVTPDGRRLVSASWDQTLKVWDLERGRMLATLNGHTDWVAACAVTPDGQRIISASADRTLKVWSMNSEHALLTLRGHADVVTACAVTPDGCRVISASADCTLKIWDLATGCVLATLDAHSQWVRACAVTPDGSCVISASDDRTLKVWDLTSGRVLLTLVGHAHWVRACAVTPDGRRVISASNDKVLKVWDLESGRALATLEGHADVVVACAVTPDGRRVVSASADRTLKVWDLASERVLVSLEGHASWVTACAITADGRLAVSASSDWTLKMWSLTNERALSTLECHAARVRACAASPDGRHVVSASDDHTLKVWDPASGRVLASLAGHCDSVTACAVTPDGQRIVSASTDGKLILWDIGGRMLRTLPCDSGPISACGLTPDGRFVFCVVLVESARDVLMLWDLQSGRRLATLPAAVVGITSCAATPDGRLVVASNRHLHVWDPASNGMPITMKGYAGRVTACTVTSDGRYAISVSEDSALKVWDMSGERVLASLHDHRDEVTACAVTPDGRRLVSASKDRTLKIWDLATFACVLTHHGDAPFTAVVACDTFVVAGDTFGNVWFLEWPLSWRSYHGRQTAPATGSTRESG